MCTLFHWIGDMFEVILYNFWGIVYYREGVGKLLRGGRSFFYIPRWGLYFSRDAKDGSDFSMGRFRVGFQEGGCTFRRALKGGRTFPRAAKGDMIFFFAGHRTKISQPPSQ